LSIVKAAIQAAIKDIEQEEARKNQDFQDWEARRMMRREVKDKARRQDTPHHGRVSQSQVEVPLSYRQFCASIWHCETASSGWSVTNNEKAGQTHARRDENANFSRGKKRGPGSDVTMQSQYTKRAKYMCEPDEMNALVFRDDDDSAQLVDASAKAVKSSSLCGTESDDSTLSL
jgi:hypothetical protein